MNLSCVFSKKENSNIFFSIYLSINTGVFNGGRSYSFRLTVYPIGKVSLKTFTEIVLIANAPPIGGYVLSVPNSGRALVTQFLISSPSWTADIANFPLSYAFAYQVGAGISFLTISTFDLRAYVTSTLPAGIIEQNSQLTLQSQVLDVFDALATAISKVSVILDPKTDVSEILTSSLGNAFANGNIDLAYQTINNVATTINVGNCTSSPLCSILNRSKCLSTPHTCGSCLKGFQGVIGDSNMRCTNASAPPIPGTNYAVGASCESNSNCLYNICESKACAAPPLMCSTNVVGTICSEQGTCFYSDPSGNALKNCTIINTSCTASCVCNKNFGGKDCSLSAEELNRKDSARYFVLIRNLFI
jgi:hypothetical protein